MNVKNKIESNVGSCDVKTKKKQLGSIFLDKTVIM